MKTGKLLLASGSPRRRDLLGWLGVPFTVVPAAAEEWPASAAAHFTPRELAWANARRKGIAVSKAHPEAWVLAADTIVVLGTTVFGKPADLIEAAIMLRQLADRRHEVLTAVGLFHRGLATNRVVACTKVTMRPLTDRQIDAYLQRVPVLDKAGAYAVQQRGDDLITRIEGSLSNVMGLPVEVVSKLLRAHHLL